MLAAALVVKQSDARERALQRWREAGKQESRGSLHHSKSCCRILEFEAEANSAALYPACLRLRVSGGETGGQEGCGAHKKNKTEHDFCDAGAAHLDSKKKEERMILEGSDPSKAVANDSEI